MRKFKGLIINSANSQIVANNQKRDYFYNQHGGGFKPK